MISSTEWGSESDGSVLKMGYAPNMAIAIGKMMIKDMLATY